MTTPYRIIVPHIPDKRLILEMTRSFYPRLIHAVVRILAPML